MTHSVIGILVSKEDRKTIKLIKTLIEVSSKFPIINSISVKI